MERPRVWGLVSTLCLLLFAHAAHAQFGDLAKATPQQRATAQTDFMKSKLGLSEAQLEKVSALNLEYAKKFDPILKGSAGRLSKVRQVRAMEAEKEAKLEQLISPEQFKTFRASQSEMRKQVMARIEREIAAGASSP
jgi:exopolysaccharide biosynthesis protein